MVGDGGRQLDRTPGGGTTGFERAGPQLEFAQHEIAGRVASSGARQGQTHVGQGFETDRRDFAVRNVGLDVVRVVGRHAEIDDERLVSDRVELGAFLRPHGRRVQDFPRDGGFRGNLLFPRGLRCRQSSIVRGERLFCCGELPLQLLQPPLLVGRGDRERRLVAVVENREEIVVVALRDRIELVVVALVQPTVKPRKTVPVVLTRSRTASMRNCSLSTPPSSLTSVLR